MITSNIKYVKSNFPVGEIDIELQGNYYREWLYIDAEIKFEYQNNEEIIELLILCDTLKKAGHQINLTIPYVPYSRQDRANSIQECFSLKTFANLINSIGAKKVTIYDPHSDVTAALINNCLVIPQHEFFEKYFFGTRDPILICPNGQPLEIFKNPKTDNGIKKSARGLLSVREIDGKLTLWERVDKFEETKGLLETVFLNGKLTKEYSLSEIRKRLI